MVSRRGKEGRGGELRAAHVTLAPCCDCLEDCAFCGAAADGGSDGGDVGGGGVTTKRASNFDLPLLFSSLFFFFSFSNIFFYFFANNSSLGFASFSFISISFNLPSFVLFFLFILLGIFRI